MRPAYSRTVNGSPVRALVVDDSPLVRHRVTKELTALGIDSVQATCFAEARAIDPSGYAFALLDLDLGDGNGADLAEIFRAANPDLPIAFFTSESAGPIWTKAEAYGPRFSKADELDTAMSWAAKFRRP